MIINATDLNGDLVRIDQVLGADMDPACDPELWTEHCLEALREGLKYGDYTPEAAEAIFYRLVTSVGHVAASPLKPLAYS